MKILLCVMFLLVSVLASAEVENGDNKLESKDLTQHPFYNTLHSRDCSIPEGTEIVHYSMRHPIEKIIIQAVEDRLSNAGIDIDIDELIAYSSFHFIKFIEQYSSVIVFEEVLWSQQELDNIDGIIEYLIGSAFMASGEELLVDVKKVNFFEDLNSKSKELLSGLSGGLATFFTGIKDSIYPVSTMSSFEEVRDSYWNRFDTDSSSVEKRTKVLEQKMLFNADRFNRETDQTTRTVLRNGTYQMYKEQYALRRLSNNFVSPYREQLLLQAVENNIKQPGNKGKMVFINYGMFHDFSDDFEDYNFYTLPYACSTPSSYFSSIYFIVDLVGLYMKNAHADVENKEAVLAILLPEIMDRIYRLSKEEQKNLGSIFKVFMQVGMGINVTLAEITPETLKTYLLIQSGSDEDRFAYKWDYLLSIANESNN